MPDTMTLPTDQDFAQRLQAALKQARGMNTATEAAPPEAAETGTAQETESPEAASAPFGAGPLGSGNYIVREGDCMSSIAHEHGHLWKSLWNEPANRTLCEARKDPNYLLPGDRVYVPSLRPNTEHGPTQVRHRFVRLGEPTFLRLRLMNGDQPRANQPYTLVAAGEEHRGTTDPEGNLEVSIPANARQGQLVVGPEGEEVAFTINLGCVHPLGELSGVQRRLNNLGFGCGEADGELSPRTRAAIVRFQERYMLPKTGEPDDATRAKLLEVHGS